MKDIENKAFELKVGIFIAVGILIFFIVVFSIGDVYIIKKGYRIKAMFNFAGGLREGAPVRLAGVNAGRVEDIEVFFDDKEGKTKVEATAWIKNNRIKIEKDSKVVINTLGLLGEKYLEILPGTDRENFLANDGVIVGHDPIITELLTEKLGELADSTATVMTRLKEGKGTVGKLLTDDTIYNDLEAFVKDIKKHPWKLLHKPRGY